MKTMFVLLASLAAAGAQTQAQAQAQAQPVRVAAVVGQYNARFAAPPRLSVATASAGDAYAIEAAALPAWLDELGLSAQELRALAATVGTYAAARPRPAEPRKPSVPEVVAGTALSIFANDAERRLASGRRGNTLADERARSPDWPASRAIGTPTPPRDLLPGRLIAFDTCGGAFFSALTRLNQSHPAASFTAFVRSVGGTAFSGPLPADPTCGGAPD